MVAAQDGHGATVRYLVRVGTSVAAANKVFSIFLSPLHKAAGYDVFNLQLLK